MATIVEPDAAVSGQPAGARLVALPLLLFAYMPRPPVAGTHFLVYPAVGGVLAVTLLLLAARWPNLDRWIIGTGIGLLALAGATAVSIIVNVEFMRTTGPLELFRLGLVAMFLLYGYWATVWAGTADARSGILAAGWAILIGQIIIAAAQLLSVPVFDPIYSAEKSRPLGSLVRAVGSFANPNMMAWMVSQAAAWVVVLDGSRWRRRGGVTLAALLVLISGSRTLLLLFPFVLLAAMAGSGRARFRPGRMALAALAKLGGIGLVVYRLGSTFPYLAQLRTVVATGSLTSINSFHARYEHWRAVAAEMGSGSWTRWLTGLGPRQITSVLDSDYLYVFMKFGILGFAFHLLLLACAGAVLVRGWREPLARIGMIYLASALVVGLVADTLGGWNYPLILFLLVGVTAAHIGGHRATATRTANVDTTKVP